MSILIITYAYSFDYLSIKLSRLRRELFYKFPNAWLPFTTHRFKMCAIEKKTLN